MASYPDTNLVDSGVDLNKLALGYSHCYARVHHPSIHPSIQNDNGWSHTFLQWLHGAGCIGMVMWVKAKGGLFSF